MWMFVVVDPAADPVVVLQTILPLTADYHPPSHHRRMIRQTFSPSPQHQSSPPCNSSPYPSRNFQLYKYAENHTPLSTAAVVRILIRIPFSSSFDSSVVAIAVVDVCWCCSKLNNHRSNLSQHHRKGNRYPKRFPEVVAIETSSPVGRIGGRGGICESCRRNGIGSGFVFVLLFVPLLFFLVGIIGVVVVVVVAAMRNDDNDNGNGTQNTMSRL